MGRRKGRWRVGPRVGYGVGSGAGWAWYSGPVLPPGHPAVEGGQVAEAADQEQESGQGGQVD